MSGRLRGALNLGLFLFLVAFCCFAAWAAQENRHRLRQAAFAEGYERGLVDALSAPRPAPACPAVAPLPPDLSCRAELASYRRTEAANRANARELGLDLGLRLAREDWHPCGRWERDRLPPLGAP